MNSVKSNMRMDISKAALTDQWRKTKKMDFSDYYIMMGQYLKESIKMGSEMVGEDISIQMEISLQKFFIIDN